MKIKRLEKDDAKDIATLVYRVMQEAKQLPPSAHNNPKCYDILYELITNEIKESMLLCYGMIIDDSLVGMVGYEPLKNEITYLYVLPEYQRQGIGSKLLDCVISSIEKPKVGLRAHEDAIPMYTKYGFERNYNDTKRSAGMTYTIRR